MHVTNLDKEGFEEFQERGAKGVKRKTLVDSRHDSNSFVLRYYVLEAGGQTPYDIHDYEHVVIVTKGEGAILTLSADVPSLRNVREGDIVFIKSKEPHQFINTGIVPFEFHCFRGAKELYATKVDEIIKQFGGR